MKTIQQQVAAQRRVVARTAHYPLLSYFAARDRLDFLLEELARCERETER